MFEMERPDRFYALKKPIQRKWLHVLLVSVSLLQDACVKHTHMTCVVCVRMRVCVFASLND
jgi:hypothetical protein